MLQTNAHNPKVPEEDKMTLKSFSSCGRGINDGKDFSPELLKQLFGSVTKKKLAVHEIERREIEKEKNAALTLKKKLDLFQEETEKILELSRKQKMSDRSAQQLKYHIVDTPAYMKQTLEVMWSPLMVALSVALRNTDDQEIINYCLEGIGYAI